MMLLFKQALLIDKKRYPQGVNDIPEKDMDHHHFKKFMKAGVIVVAGKSEAAGKKTLKDLPVLNAPRSAAAQRSAHHAKAVLEKEKALAEEASPISEIGGEPSAEEVAPDEEAVSQVSNKYGKKKGK